MSEQPVQPCTKSERDDHITRWRKYAEHCAYCIAKQLPMDASQQRFTNMVLREAGNPDDHAAALRAFAKSYSPGKHAAGTYGKVRAVDTAYAYAIHRAKGMHHTTVLKELVDTYATGNNGEFAPTNVRWQGLWKAIEPLLPSVCDDLGIDPALLAVRQPPGRPSKNKAD